MNWRQCVSVCGTRVPLAVPISQWNLKMTFKVMLFPMFCSSSAPKARRFRSWQRCAMQWRKVCLAEWRSSKTCKKRWGYRSTLHLPESAWFYVPCVLACPCASARVTVNIFRLVFLECMLVSQSISILCLLTLDPKKKKNVFNFVICKYKLYKPTHRTNLWMPACILWRYSVSFTSTVVKIHTFLGT